MHVGCVDLLNAVQLRVKPKYHIFGHIHEGKVHIRVVVCVQCSVTDLVEPFRFEKKFLITLLRFETKLLVIY